MATSAKKEEQQSTQAHRVAEKMASKRSFSSLACPSGQLASSWWQKITDPSTADCKWMALKHRTEVNPNARKTRMDTTYAREITYVFKVQ